MYQIHPTSSRVDSSIELSPPSITISLDSIYDSTHHNVTTKCRFFCDRYRRIITCVILITIVIIIIILATSLPSQVSDNPCITYSSEDYVSQVSMACFRYLWDRSCKVSLPTNFNGEWWLRSPSGGRMVPCITSYKDPACGAGSYKTLTTYLYRCNPYYDGK